MIEVQFTADLYTQESMAEGIADTSGWVNYPSDSSDILEDSDDAQIHIFEDEAEAVAYISDALGSFNRNGNTFYAEDAVPNMVTGDMVTYAAHII